MPRFDRGIERWHQMLKNRIVLENYYLPVRRRERKQQKFKSPGSAQRFLAIHAATYNAFYHQRHLLRRPHFKQLRAASFGLWTKASAAA